MKVLITGGAGGIGAATARLLEERGHRPVLFDSDSEALENLEFESYHGRVENEERVKEVVEDLKFEVLVNCAGYYELGAIEDMGDSTARQILDSNFFGALNTIRHSIDDLIDRSGRIVNVSSVAGRTSLPFYGAYCASKNALEAASDALRMELQDSGVEVVLVEPGPVETGFNRRARQAVEKYIPGSRHTENYRRQLEKQTDGVKPEKAARRVVEAVEAESPRPRYRVGKGGWTVPVMEKLLPAFLKDRLKLALMG